tara:strand:- start:505 stop:687 length:183 start_codon:yes stop_codon:yes gene_type:complete
MNKLKTLKDSSFKNNESNDEDNKKKNKNRKKLEKILCNHCGRTSTNGIRCLGICVADNDY